MNRRILGILWALLILHLTGHSMATAAEATRPVKALAGRYIIGISPFLDTSIKDEVYRRVVGFLLEDLPLSSSLGLYDAYNLHTISQMDIPDVPAFRTGKTRANQFAGQIQKLREFLAETHPGPDAATQHLAQAVRFPQFMDFVGENLITPDQRVTVIMLGSPLYLDAKEPGFSMVDGYFPSDGHLSASREQSVFGIKNRTEALKNVNIHFGYFGDPWVSEVHKEKITRFWSLHLQGQGAHLSTFCGDLATVFNAACVSPNTSQSRGQHYEIDPARSKIEMLRVTRDIGIADWITRDVLSNSQNTAPTTTIGKMKIGIRWQGQLDLDLYASPNERAETLFFDHPRSPEGYYYKDHRSSPEREYEFIEFTSAVDVRKVEAQINLYEGAAPQGASGEVRIEFAGRIYSGRFSIPASRGNEGRSGSHQGEFWTRINILELLKLDDARISRGD